MPFHLGMTSHERSQFYSPVKLPYDRSMKSPGMAAWMEIAQLANAGLRGGDKAAPLNFNTETQGCGRGGEALQAAESKCDLSSSL
jgi:hypothetical protein